MGEDGHRLHPKLKTLVQVLAVKHATANVRLDAGNVTLVESVVAAVAVPAALSVLLVALVVALLPAWTPKQPALVAVAPAGSLVAERLPHLARDTVHLEDVLRAKLVVASAEFRKVTLVLGQPADVAWRLWFAGLEVAALSSGTGGVGVEAAGCWVAARVVTMLLQPTVTLFSRLDKAVAADGALKQGPGLVSQTVVHAVLKGQGKVLQAAGRPKAGFHCARGWSHDAPVVGTLAALAVVLHPKVVAELVSHGGCHQADHLRVPHAHPP